MSFETTLRGRMLEYENNANYKLIKKLPVIVRIDGRGFSKFTKGFDKPFDEDISKIFQGVAYEIRKQVDNVKFIYSQSDEINILMTDWNKDKQEDGGRIDAWYDYRLQKIISVLSSITTAKFNELLSNKANEYKKLSEKAWSNNNFNQADEYIYKCNLLLNRKFKAIFDARVFNVPLDEVTNYFIQRQQDAIRNSVSSLARCYYSHKQLEGISNKQMKKMLKDEHNIDYESDISVLQKLGFTIVDENNTIKIDTAIPLFKENREYIERFI